MLKRVCTRLIAAGRRRGSGRIYRKTIEWRERFMPSAFAIGIREHPCRTFKPIGFLPSWAHLRRSDSRETDGTRRSEYQPILRFTIRTLDRLRIDYAIGGSIASSLHGVNRMTRDADLTVEPFRGREELFIVAFDPSEYYLSEDSVREALRDRSTFNILHPGTGYKIDIFVLKEESFEREAFSRRQTYPMPDAPNDPVYLQTPEDIVLFKLRGYRLGGESSEKHWTDILGVLRTQGDAIDQAYLDHWSAEIGVKDLLERIRKQV
jgi:hypothetical protein